MKKFINPNDLNIEFIFKPYKNIGLVVVGVGDGGRTLHFTNGHTISVNENRKMFEYASNESLEGIVFECITDRNYMPETPFLRVVK